MAIFDSCFVLSCVFFFLYTADLPAHDGVLSKCVIRVLLFSTLYFSNCLVMFLILICDYKLFTCTHQLIKTSVNEATRISNYKFVHRQLLSFPSVSTRIHIHHTQMHIHWFITTHTHTNAHPHPHPVFPMFRKVLYGQLVSCTHSHSQTQPSHLHIYIGTPSLLLNYL